jgi:hypothetical protein
MRSVRERGRELNAGLHFRIPAPKMQLGGDMQQLLQLSKKNFIVKARNKRATLLELWFSLFCLYMIILLIKLPFNDLSSYEALPTLPLLAPSPLGTPTSQLALPLTCLYSESATACASGVAQVPNWYQHFHP